MDGLEKGSGAGGGEAAPRLRWEGADRDRILVLDCSNNTREQAYEQFYALQKVLAGLPHRSVRLLVNFENAVHETNLTRLWKEAALENDKVVSKAALIGISGGMKVAVAAYRFYTMFRGMEVDAKMKYFDHEDQARAWLLEA